jgi:predicted metal-dependent phosphoesterase TrpH
VVRRAAAAGLSAIALTDHDSVGGISEARAAGEGCGLAVISGCEFSVQGLNAGELHLLAYGLREHHPALVTFLASAREARAQRGERILSLLAKLGVAIQPAELEAQAKGATIGRPHVARALIARGIVRSFDEAFDRFLGRGRPAYVPKVLPKIEAITALVRDAGGVSAIAHPKDRERDALLQLRTRGIDAVEVCHPSHPPAVRARLEQLARELGMLCTGGSDSHGELEANRSHSLIGGERIPLQWAEDLLGLARSRGGG